jgi:hypothetical protein
MSHDDQVEFALAAFEQMLGSIDRNDFVSRMFQHDLAGFE